MKTLLLLSFVIIYFFACQSAPQKNTALKKKEETQQSVNQGEKNPVVFSYGISAKSAKKGIVFVEAALNNTSTDTVYFLSTSCEGDKYLLKYDTVNFRLTDNILCNMIWPVVQYIAPGNSYRFTATINALSDTTHILLGFDFYEVDKGFDITKISVSDIRKRKPELQNIIKPYK